MLSYLPALIPFVSAQPRTATQSPAWQTDLLRQYTARQQRTARLAKQHGWTLIKKYSGQQVFRLQDVDDTGQPVYYRLHNAEAASATHTTALQGGSSLSVTLSGNSARMAGRLGLWDGGRVLATHQELGAVRIQQNNNAASLSDHATHLAGTLIGKGIDSRARGMAYGAQLTVWDYTDDLSELTTAAPKLLLSNHAYGPVVGWVYNPSRPGTDPNLKWEWWGNTAVSATDDYLFGFYTAKARDLDRLAYNNPFLLMVRSADNKRVDTGPPAGTPYFLRDSNNQSTLPRQRNDAYDVIPAEATAKNVLTVGAADISQSVQQVTTTDFSGWGPTDDGRIKPDLMGLGTRIYSSMSSSNASYGTYSGTSMASANVTGSLFLLQELYAQQRATSPSAPGQFMRSATLRGLALHTATRPNPAAGPNYRIGWGLLHTEAAARVLLNDDLAHLVLEQSLAQGQQFSRRLVAQGNEPLIVTLCWTDPEGVASPVAPASVNSPTPKLVNDLDLRLTDSQSTLFPFVLDPANPAAPATRGDNSRDNVEQIYIANPIPGQAYTVQIAHKAKLTYGNQPFSIIVSGLRRASCGLTLQISPRRDTILCPGSSLSLQSSIESDSYQYQWLLNGVNIASAETARYTTSQPGSYALRITDQAGCVATSAPVSVSVRTADVQISPTGEQWLCTDGKPIQLQASGLPTANARPTWLRDGEVITGAVSPSFSTTQPGSYRLQVNLLGCDIQSEPTTIRQTTVSSIALTPTETQLFLPLGAAVTLRAPVDTSYRYQWYRNKTALPNATRSQLSISQSGTYSVQVTQKSCVGWSSDRTVEVLVVTGTSTSADPQLRYFPNPAHTALSVQYTDPVARQVEVRVFDTGGRQVLPTQRLSRTGGGHEGTIPLTDLPPGPYLLQLLDERGSQTIRFVRQ